ncbi:MAG: ATP-binding protein, partial [Methanoregulaceae archaeon]
AIVTAAVIIPLQVLFLGGTRSPLAIPSVIISAFLGIGFFSLKGWKPFGRLALTIQLLSMSLLLGGIMIISMLIVILPDSGRNNIFPIIILPIILIIGGILILGNIIGFIDRKKKTEREILLYRDHLEGLVHERTVELERINSLLKATLESTADGIVVVDTDGLIRAFNRKAAELLEYPEHDMSAPDVTKKFSEYAVNRLSDPEPVIHLVSSFPLDSEQVMATNVHLKNGRTYELFVLPQRLGDKIVGRVWNFRDITDQKNAEEALKSANNKLMLLSSITRHDTLNQLTALIAYHHLIEEKAQNPEVIEYLTKMKKILDVIHLQIEFASDYQDMGVKKPVWHNAEQVFKTATESFEIDRIRFCFVPGENKEIFADPLLERVFYNLIDNSIRHGERVSEISLTAQRSGDELILVYEDNGMGVPDSQKEKIFEKGVGKHTGLGMFLIREILGITGITIRENGISGTGVRFEMRVPAGKFR